MNSRYAFSIFGVNVAWYGILMAFAILLGAVILGRIGEKRGYKKDDIYDLVLWIIPLALLGARLYYVAFEWEFYSKDLIRIFALREGGMAIHGGIIGGLLGGYIFSRIKGLRFADLADMVSMPLILGQAIGRWGNFANGEAHGGPTDLPWAIEVGGVNVHPTFLYESVWNFLIFIFLVLTFKKRKYYGFHFLKYMALYSVGRFFIEGMRTDSLMFFGMRIAQIVSIGMILLAFVLGFMIKRKDDNKIPQK